jgi:myo-inositol-1(or 4)-monophosphatase
LTGPLNTFDVSALLDAAKAAARQAGHKLSEIAREGRTRHEFDRIWNREIKAEADLIIESILIEDLSSTGIPILSEESGEISGDSESKLRFIVDPIDGTANFIRGIGESSVSIALFKENEPLFGVMWLHPRGQLVWGGPGLGSFIDGVPIQVSNQEQKNRAVLCTGIPARLDLRVESKKNDFVGRILEFSKVRMLGAASISLLQVAKGSADCYAEEDVMIWDIAAGLAIVCGSGGVYELSGGTQEHSRDVLVHNGKLYPKDL